MASNNNATIADRYAQVRKDHPGISASQAIIHARSLQRDATLYGPHGMDWEDSPNYRNNELARAIVPLPSDPKAIPSDWAPYTYRKGGQTIEESEPRFIAVVTCHIDDDGSGILDCIGEFTDSPEYPRKGHRPRSFNRKHGGTFGGRYASHGEYEWFTPDCDPEAEAKHWPGSKHDRWLKATQCARGQWDFAEKVSNGDVSVVGYTVEVYDYNELGWDDDSEEYIFDDAQPIGEASCWGFAEESDKDRDANASDLIHEAWRAAYSEVANAEAWANQH